MTSEQSLKINLGCGNMTLPGWRNVDNSYGILVARHRVIGELLSRMKVVPREWWSSWAGKEVSHMDIRKGVDFPSGSAEFIYSSHVLEHLEHGEAESLIAECHRVLRPGGLLRMATPDLEYMIVLYRSLQKGFERDNPQGKVPGDHFIRCLWMSPENTAKKRSALPGIFSKRAKHLHHWLYDFDSLYLILKQKGFTDIRRTKMGVGEMADLDKLEKDYPYPESLFVEARK